MRIFDTKSRKLEEFEPIEPGHVRFYTCGPTVYDYAHIGNFRTYVWEDLLRRTLKLHGYRVTQVMNITDVEDKILARAMAEGKSLEEVTEPYIQAFFEDLDTLGIERAEHYPRATEHIDEMVELAQTLGKKGHTYESQGSTYFRIDSCPGYGALSHLDKREIRIGARVDNDEYEKNDARDFALWKAKREGEPFWPGPLGEGRPGWHLECSAMGMKYLGESFDLHTGGVDNIFPHHENEIAQSEAATGKRFVKYWMHAAHLMVDGEKMSKSKGNFYTLRDLLKLGHDTRAIRLVLLSTHYRSSLNFTLEAASKATHEVARIDDFLDRLDRETTADRMDPVVERPEFRTMLEEAEAEFRQSLGDDLNVSGAIGALFRVIKRTHAALDAGPLSSVETKKLRDLLAVFDSVVGVLERPERSLEEGETERIEDLVTQRQLARENRDWAEADRIRDLLAEQDIVLEDTADGVRWKKRSSSAVD